MEQKNFWQYAKMVMRRAFPKPWKTLGGLGRLISIIVPIIASILYKPPVTWADLWSTSVIAALLILGIYLALLLCFIVREPVIVYNEQQTKIKSLNDTFIGPPANLK